MEKKCYFCTNEGIFTKILFCSYVGSIKSYLHDTALKHMPANMQVIKLEEMCKWFLNLKSKKKKKLKCTV